VNYSVSLCGERDIIPAHLARAVWDVTPDDLRTGSRDGAFILWDEDERGWRTRPAIFRPVAA
jgi:hypothetical protein